MLGSAGYFYYKEQLANIDGMCGMSMENIAMQVEKELLIKDNIDDISQLLNSRHHLKVGLFNKYGEVIKSNLTNNKINFNQINYPNKSSALYIMKLNKSNQVKYIVIQDSALSKNIDKLKRFIWSILILASIFLTFIGYLLSRILLKPVKENFEILSRFMKDSAHELNTPVTALMMSANYLKKAYDPEMVEHMLMSSKMIAQTYNSIAYLAFNDLDIEVKETFDLSEYIYESIKYFKEIAANKNININAQLNRLTIHMDKNSIRKLINNLISNAIKYSYSNKSIEITLQKNILTIKDEGVGIDKKDQKKIFERYKRIAQKGSGGFGIGLDIVMEICRTNNIQISLESEVNKGSTFTLIFPQ